MKQTTISQPERKPDSTPLRNRFADLRREYPLPSATGETADKAFFDALSGAE